MKRITLLTALLLAFVCAGAQPYTLSSGDIRVTVSADGRLTELRNLATGHNYAGGGSLWRIFYNNLREKEIQISGAEQTPQVSADGTHIRIDYPTLRCRGQELAIALHLTLTLEDGQHTVVRELHYPLVGDLQLPEGYRLLTTHTGGQLFDDPVETIVSRGNKFPYMTPAQKFRQYDVQYPRNLAANCFALLPWNHIGRSVHT